ncbi:MAG: hypothetical protein WC661_03125 [Opitutaceae bacterium]|jgi:hypothetical protein
MNPSEQALVSYLTGIKDQKIGFIELYTDGDGWCADISLDARYDLFASECIFDDCNDAQAKTFLAAFLAHDLSVGWSIAQQLSKLLSTRGHLVSETINLLLTTLDWRSYATQQLFLSCLASHDDGASLAIRLLDEVPEDSRDGLFLSCHRLRSEPLDRRLMKKFVEWDTGPWSPGSTGELGALEQFIAKWLRLYPYRDLEAVIRLYFKHRAES